MYNFVIGRPDGEEPRFDGQVTTQGIGIRLDGMISELPDGFPKAMIDDYRRLLKRNILLLNERQVCQLKVKKVYPGQRIEVWPMSD
jgi:hypothetical protein